MKCPEINSDLEHELRDRWVMVREELGKSLPLIMDEYCYVFFGENVKIVEVNMFDSLENAEVVVESSLMEQKQVEFNELTWRTNYKLADAGCKISRREVMGLGTLGLSKLQNTTDQGES